MKRSSQPQLALKPSSEDSLLAWIWIIRCDTCRLWERKSMIHFNSSSTISTSLGFFSCSVQSLFFSYFIVSSYSFWLHHTPILFASTPNSRAAASFIRGFLCSFHRLKLVRCVVASPLPARRHRYFFYLVTLSWTNSRMNEWTNTCLEGRNN